MPTQDYLLAKIQLCGELALAQMKEGQRTRAIGNIDRMIYAINQLKEMEEASE
jgi:hypothetical protein